MHLFQKLKESPQQKKKKKKPKTVLEMRAAEKEIVKTMNAKNCRKCF